MGVVGARPRWCHWPGIPGDRVVTFLLPARWSLRTGVGGLLTRGVGTVARKERVGREHGLYGGAEWKGPTKWEGVHPARGAAGETGARQGGNRESAARKRPLNRRGDGCGGPSPRTRQAGLVV